MTKTRILISYARADSLGASARLRSELQQAGYEVWRDIEEMRGGKDWKEQLRQAIVAVDAVIVLLTPAAVASKYVLWECDTAQTLDKFVVGLLIQACDVPDELSRLHYHDLSVAEKYVVGFANLIRDLSELKAKTMPEDNTKQTKSQFDFSGASIDRSQIGHDNTMINNPSKTQDGDLLLARLIQQIGALLKSEHQQLRLTLITELQAMSAEQRQQIEMIVQYYQQGRIRSHDMAAFMSDVRTVLTALQNEANFSNSQLAQISKQVEQVFDSHLSQEHKFELTLPIVPGILEYKYSFGGTIDTNLRNLIDNLRQSWDAWAS